MKKNIKLIYNNVEKGIIGIHLFACLFISGNIFFYTSCNDRIVNYHEIM